MISSRLFFFVGLPSLSIWMLAAAPAQAQITVTAPSGVEAMAAADDFATRAFQDPWDMNERTDFGWFAYAEGADAGMHPGITNLNFTNGIFSATTTSNDPNLFLLETGNPGAAPVGKIGYNYPIDADTYRVLAFRMSLSPSSSFHFTQFLWNRTDFYDDATAQVNLPMVMSPGWRIYTVNLPDLAVTAPAPSWDGIIRSLRFDPTAAPAGQTIQVDWMRLVTVNAGLCRTVTWTGPASQRVDIHLDTDADPSNGTLGPVALNVLQTGNSSPICGAPGSGFPLYAGALPGGDYYVAIRPTAGGSFAYSAGRYEVNDIPLVTPLAPSEEGSDDDFATTVLGNPWDMDALTDIDRTFHMTGAQITTIDAETEAGAPLDDVRVFSATSVQNTPGLVGDPYFYTMWSTQRGLTNRIDPDRYRILTVEFGLPDSPRSISNGSIARIVWRVAGDGDGGENVSDDIIFNHMSGANIMNRVVLDMKTLPNDPNGSPSTTGWTKGTTSNPGVDNFRFDPHEFSDPTPFFVRRLKLAALEEADDSYTIEWSATEPGATVSLYRDTDRDAATKTLIASGLPASDDSYVWNTSTVPAGQYYIYVQVADGENSNGAYARWPLVIDHNEPLPTMSLSRTTLHFGVANSGRVNEEKTTPQRVRVDIAGAGAPCWTVASNSPYIDVAPPGGAGTASFTVQVAGSPPVGHIVAAVTVASCTSPSGIENSPQQVTVNLRTSQAGRSAKPFGYVDTPVNNATGVQGSLAMTGWVLDDVEVARVRIYRDPVSPEPAGTLIYAGDATRVDDARPDVELAMPSWPYNYKAAWGYLWLTNMLPNQGNGRYTLHAIAEDVEGNSVLLGSRTITSNNAQATKPFGAIDTPDQGATVSGDKYVNWGWALTQAGKFIPLDGSTIGIYVDGVRIGSPNYGHFRSDIADLFPGFVDNNRALGYYKLDTTSYENGVHTIAWGVTDSNGDAAGIGSRYFTVENLGGGGAQADLHPPLLAEQSAPPEPLDRLSFEGLTSLDEPLLPRPRHSAAASPDTLVRSASYRPSDAGRLTAGGWEPAGAARSVLMKSRLAAFSVTASPAGRSGAAAAGMKAIVQARYGLDPEAPLEPLSAGSDGVYIATVVEVGRLEIHLPALPASEAYQGELRVGQEAKPLPIGSTLDRDGGVFYWQPGVGFVGRYDLAFFTETEQGRSNEVRVAIVIEPEDSGGANPRMWIDTPTTGTIAQPFLVAGWALDMGAVSGTGVDTVHLWAYANPGSGTPPRFLGVASYGGPRLDLAAAFGSRFRDASFGLFVGGLDPGLYDIVAFAHSTVTNSFSNARTVRVTIAPPPPGGATGSE